jgi:NADPH:quinone reductase-like Zn-dependent oxidoreductase
MSDWDLLVMRDNLRQVELRRDAHQDPLGEGEVRLGVERFALTANNITYGAMGDSFGYWKFFPAPEGMGRIPVWGFARVTESAAPDVPVGLRLFGYLPMATSFTARLAKGRDGFVDRAEHRAELPPTYNAYAEAPEDALDDHRALLRPLFMTSWLLDDFLGEDAKLATVVMSSASSKTGLGLAWFARRRGLEVIGLTSPANVATVEGTGLFDRVLPYGEAARLTARGPAAYVDFAGDPKTTAQAHEALGDRLVRSIIVGATHWDADRAPQSLSGPAPALFFAPDQIRKRMGEWGPSTFDQRFTQALKEFVADASWLKLRQHAGPEDLLAAYHDVLEGRARPDEGFIIRPA